MMPSVLIAIVRTDRHTTHAMRTNHGEKKRRVQTLQTWPTMRMETAAVARGLRGANDRSGRTKTKFGRVDFL